MAFYGGAHGGGEREGEFLTGVWPSGQKKTLHVVIYLVETLVVSKHRQLWQTRHRGDSAMSGLLVSNWSCTNQYFVVVMDQAAVYNVKWVTKHFPLASLEPLSAFKHSTTISHILACIAGSSALLSTVGYLVANGTISVNNKVSSQWEIIIQYHVHVHAMNAAVVQYLATV